MIGWWMAEEAANGATRSQPPPTDYNKPADIVAPYVLPFAEEPLSVGLTPFALVALPLLAAARE